MDRPTDDIVASSPSAEPGVSPHQAHVLQILDAFDKRRAWTDGDHTRLFLHLQRPDVPEPLKQRIQAALTVMDSLSWTKGCLEGAMARR